MFLSITGFALHIKKSRTRVAQLLAQGRITGVQRMSGNRWLIPDNATIKPGKSNERRPHAHGSRHPASDVQALRLSRVRPISLCRFIEPDHVVVRGVKFRDEDDAYDAMVQSEVDGD
jgi:hypothetical protein